MSHSSAITRNAQFLMLLLVLVLGVLLQDSMVLSFTPSSSFSVSFKSSRQAIKIKLSPGDIDIDSMGHIANLNLNMNMGTHIDAAMSTMYTATLPPIDPDSATGAIATMKDYFIPTTSNEATLKALEGYVQAKQAISGSGATLPNSSDLIHFDSVMPGSKGMANPSFLDIHMDIDMDQSRSKYTYHEKIDKRELEWIAQQFDIYMRKIPFAVTVYALLDFFVLSPGNNPDFISDELEEDRTGLVRDWLYNATMKAGILASIVVGIIFIENLTYHPVV